MVEHGRLGRPRARGRRGATATACSSSAHAAPSSASARSSISRRPRWTWPSRRPSSVGVNVGRAAELERAPDVVQQRGREQEVGAEPRVQLRRLAAERRDADRVLEQAARVAVVAVRAPRAAPRSRSRSCSSSTKRPTTAARPGCESSPARNSRKPSSSSASRRSAGASAAGSASRRLVERAHVELQPVAEPLDAAEHAHGVALGEARVEQLDVVPHARVDPPARIDELEREVRAPRRASAAAASSPPRRRPRRPGPPRAPRSRARERSLGRAPAGTVAADGPRQAVSRRSATTRRRPGRSTRSSRRRTT